MPALVQPFHWHVDAAGCGATSPEGLARRESKCFESSFIALSMSLGRPRHKALHETIAGSRCASAITPRQLDMRNPKGPPVSVEATIREKLVRALAPARLDIVNESHL